MKIIVCIKQVPDTTEVKIDKETGTLIRNGIPTIINPEDKNALEAALKIKEERGAEITVITMGPPQAKNALYEAMAMGADKAVLLSDAKFAGADTLSTSLTLAAAIKKYDYDLILAGRQAIDGDTAQVGPEIAEHLNIPQATYAKNIVINDEKTIQVERMLDDGFEIVEYQMPILITAIKELNTPRYMKPSLIFNVFEKEIEILKAEDLDVDLSQLGLKGSPTKVRKSRTREIGGAGEIIKTNPKEAVDILLKKLNEKKLISSEVIS
ncbi:MAG TPA: electron transfer flavoprotein subunit beta/FixA family protein [Thermotogota bacterium]|nr:electron transfer flavoprotein subunit beta/FixA family protein [Thermotogota bacterium]HPJ87584.1 electron transfer flavoprotein subunit beta/FixA family protein [Thermotogota bacterium]HPR94789.1 electron transfer flavoprotein subunit beta/FixA family protein [Thermotogota bacterium]